MSQILAAKKLLIIDDEPDIVELLCEEMRDHGYLTQAAYCGNEAIELLKNEHFDAVISDYKMPNGNGMDVLKFVNQIEVSPVFYFISGQADISIEYALAAGAKHFFPKPFNLIKLIERVNADLSSSTP